MLNDAYMPAGRGSVSGAITIKHFTPDDLDAYSHFAEVALTAEKDRLLLSTTAAVQYVRIETGFMNTDGTTFTPNHTVFAASDLTSENAIVLETDLANSNQTLRLSYQSNGQTVYTYITEDTVA